MRSRITKKHRSLALYLNRLWLHWLRLLQVPRQSRGWLLSSQKNQGQWHHSTPQYGQSSVNRSRSRWRCNYDPALVLVRILHGWWGSLWLCLGGSPFLSVDMKTTELLFVQYDLSLALCAFRNEPLDFFSFVMTFFTTFHDTLPSSSSLLNCIALLWCFFFPPRVVHCGILNTCKHLFAVVPYIKHIWILGYLRSPPHVGWSSCIFTSTSFKNFLFSFA